MRKSDPALEKYWVKKSGYFRLATTVASDMDIKYGNLPFCHGISEGNVDKTISIREYNNITVYDCFNNLFTADFDITNLNISLITIDDRPIPHKIAC